MLCFVFSALVVVLDQLFKHWAVLELASGTEITLIPGLFGLTYAENTGAAFSIFSNATWILAGISFFASLFLIFILLRYNEGFGSRLGLAAVLGGAVGNLVDRAFRGFVVDMFEFKFISFAVFNIADTFITVGGIIFLIFFIISSAKAAKKPANSPASGQSAPTGPRVLPRTGAVPEAQRRPVRQTPPLTPRISQPEPSFAQPPKQPVENPSATGETDGTGDYSDYVKGLSETSILEEFDLERLLSEYGINDRED